MSQHELDEVLAKIRSEQADDDVVKAGAGRVFRKLFDSAFIASEPSGKIRGCVDLRGLIPAYLNKTLAGPRALLLEDHVLACVDCRRALHEARFGVPSPKPISINRNRRPRVPMLVWATAAALLIGVGLGLTGRLPGQNTVTATVKSVQGTLYRVTDLSTSLVEAGAILKNTDELRTAKGSHAILMLAGGTMVEIAERSEVGLSGGGWRSPSVKLERGQMIVDARNANQKSFNVTSGEMTIPVRNGVVALNHGTKDSHLAVAKGSFDVRIGPASRPATEGHIYEYGAELRRVNLPVSSEFSWSQNSASYLELLQQFSGLQKDIENIPTPGVRYSSNLPQYLPAETFVYAAIPNIGGTITEAKKLFDSRLAESEVLREWWAQKSISQNGEFDRMVDQISSISNYLGNEIVVAVDGDVAGEHAGPVFMAEIKQAGLAEYLQTNLPAGAQVQIVTAGEPISPNGNKLLIEMDNNILVASPSAAQLKRVEDIVQKIASGTFTSTPFFARINKVYQHGAGYFLAANLEQIRAKSVTKSTAAITAGLENVQYLVLERNGDGEMRAALSFEGARQGIASWLSAPGPAGSLDFASPNANFAASIVMKNPRAMMQELLGMAGNANSNFTQQLNDFQAKTGVNLIDDVAGRLGSDVTIAMEGIAPILALEVNDPSGLEQTIGVLVERFNQQAPATAGHLTLASNEVNGRTFFSISNDKSPDLAAHYTFVDGYLLASTSEANVLTAIQDRQTGNTLASSEAFRAKLPADGYSNFSAMVYSNMAPLGALAKQLPASQKQQVLSGILANSGSGLVCVYGETDRIIAAAKGSFLGFDLGTLVGLEEGKPLHTMMANAPVGARKAILN